MASGAFNIRYPSAGGASSNASVGLTGAAAPASATEVGFVDGSGNLQPFSGTSSVSGPNVTVSNFPGTQPVSGTVTANQGTAGASPWPVSAAQSGTWNITNISGTVSLPTGASTSSLQTTGNTSLSSIDTKTPALGQALAAASTPVVLTAAQITTLTPLTSVTVTQATGTNLHTVVDSSALPTGASTSALQTTGNTSLATIATNSGNIPTVGQKTMAGSQPVAIASDQSAIATLAPHTATAALTNVASSATSVTVLASNVNRKQATVYNDSTQILYLKFGTTASVTSYTVQLSANAYYELPGITCYTGGIDGIWASANGNARVTEIS